MYFKKKIIINWKERILPFFLKSYRFDLIYLILDKPDPSHDRALANHILSFYTNPDPSKKSKNAMETDNEDIIVCIVMSYYAASCPVTLF